MKTIVVLTSKHDTTADHVVSSMAKRNISVFRFDTSDFPLNLTLDATLKNNCWYGKLVGEQGSLDLETIRSVWYRRPEHYRVHNQLPDMYQQFAEGESAKGFGGVLYSLDCLWVSHPNAQRAASYKPVQLTLARALGFLTPRTLITNNPEEFIRFYHDCDGQIICKTLNNGFIAVGGDEYHAIYTSIVSLDMVQKHADNVRQTAHLFQEMIPKERELRITVIGTSVYTVAIDRQSERTQTDWRRFYQDLTYDVYELPENIRQQCVALIHKLNLAFGTIDIILTPTGKYIFLEINANGQYLWLEEATKLPLTEAMADLLIAGRIEEYI